MRQITAVCAMLLFTLLMAGCAGRRSGGELQTPGPAMQGTAAPEQPKATMVPEFTAEITSSPEDVLAAQNQTPMPQATAVKEGATAHRKTQTALDQILSGMDDVKAAAAGLDEVEQRSHPGAIKMQSTN